MRKILNRLSHNRRWCYGSSAIEEVSSYKHLGLLQTKRMQPPGDIDSVVNTVRGTFFSLSNIGVHASGLNPLTALKLYKSIVLPRALFGCDLWSDIPVHSMRKLEVIHHFCLKYMQGFRKRTRSDAVLGMLGETSIESFIDLQKLNFLFGLCSSRANYVVRYLFLQRLYQYRMHCSVVHKGFIPDITRILHKYGLSDYLDRFAEYSVFPGKYVWKSVCKTAILCKEEQSWRERMLLSRDFDRFRYVQTDLSPSYIWKSALRMPGTFDISYHLARLCTLNENTFHNEFICSKCWSSCDDELKHLLSDCDDIGVRNTVNHFWHDMQRQFGENVYRLVKKF